MPQFGLKPVERTAPVATPADLPELPWTLPGAEVVQITYEVDLEAALDLLPEALSRPVPPYARLVITRYPSSPIGPCAEALLLLACRYRMEPKQFVVACVVTSEAARRAAAALWGIDARTGSVELQRQRTATGTEEITASVAAGEPLASVTLRAAYAIEPAMIRYDPFVSVRRDEDDKIEVFQFTGAPVVREARLAKGAVVACQTDAWADPWFRLRSLNMISATFAVADLERTAPVVQPAAGGGGSAGAAP
ncbi:MAG TPA: acetoacetate decarboxylase family protein [Dehalococcoidia bacterium]|nr:acetoacetate decarboxylase family protein [Dehalococcoidia bacterium]